MTNSNEDFNPVYNNPLPPEFAHWSLDLYLDDDEFRAGYPFSDIPEIESNKTGETYNTSKTFDNGVVQSNNSSGSKLFQLTYIGVTTLLYTFIIGICIATTKENNQLTELSTEQQEKQADGRLESCLMDERHKNHAIHSGQLNSYKKEDLGDDHQH
ncbi:unnamed protein product, partial [Rotaria sordida]